LSMLLALLLWHDTYTRATITLRPNNIAKLPLADVSIDATLTFVVGFLAAVAFSPLWQSVALVLACACTLFLRQQAAKFPQTGAWDKSALLPLIGEHVFVVLAVLIAVTNCRSSSEGPAFQTVDAVAPMNMTAYLYVQIFPRYFSYIATIVKYHVFIYPLVLSIRLWYVCRYDRDWNGYCSLRLRHSLCLLCTAGHTSTLSG
jgi:hypothetical protein